MKACDQISNWVLRAIRRSLVCGLTLALGTASFQSMANGQTAQRSVEVLHSGTSHRPLFGVDFQEDGRRGIAVGDRGTLVLTEDGGLTWTAKDLTIDLALIGVAVEGEQGLAVGQSGLILARKGGQWREVESGTEERLMAVDLNGKGLAVVVGSFGTVLVSKDSGETWEPIPQSLSEHIEGGYDPHLFAVQVDPNGTITIVGEFGFIAQSSDQGESWEIRHEGEESLSGLQIRPSGIGFAVGQDGAVLKTTDAGKTWEPVVANLTGNLLGVVSTDEGKVLVPGMRHMYVSDDDGRSWKPVTDGDVNSHWYAQAAATAEGIIAVGHSGRIIKVEKAVR
ncbi:photosystem II stability/assembly factor-like protein [Proteobacteria bacterium 005FR1]|nr:photosystem II stability/assembly factor-like protein [Proteobacteria bacterium 005FR1]